MRNKASPPTSNEKELKTRGLIFLPYLETIILLKPDVKFTPSSKNIPIISSSWPRSSDCLPMLTKTTPAMPAISVAVLFFVKGSFLIIREAITAIIKGCTPIITAPTAPGTRSMPE